MRFRLLFPWLTGALIAIAGGLWLHELAKQAELQARAEVVTREEHELARLRAERERLRDQVLATDAQDRNVPVASVDHAADSPAAVAHWQRGEWTPVTAWSNEGRATPKAAIATLLWAAAAGDLAMMRNMLSLDEATLARAQVWFDSLPASSRDQYHSPEDLVVGVTVGSIPPTGAQVSWLHQTDDNRAIVGMLLATPASSESSTATLSYQPGGGGAPPGLRQTRSPYRVVVLNLQRAPDGWRVQVPSLAVDAMAGWLRRPGGG